MTGRVLVTGAAGFIGGHCCEALAEAGYDVVGIDNFDPFYPRALKEPTVARLARRYGVHVLEGDVRDRAVLAGALAGVETVVHFAARGGVRPSLREPALYAELNVGATVAVLEACHHRGVERLVFASSSSVYGNAPVPFREDAPVARPESPYGASKRAAELFCETHARLHGMRIMALRLFTAYGPRQRPDLAVSRFTRALFAGEPITQYGDGSSERDYTHVDDIVRGAVAAVRWTEPGRDAPMLEVVNLGTGRAVRLATLIRLLADAAGTAPTLESGPAQPGDLDRTWADITKARALLAYQPRVAIEDGIRQFVSWYEESHARKHDTAA